MQIVLRLSEHDRSAMPEVARIGLPTEERTGEMPPCRSRDPRRNGADEVAWPRPIARLGDGVPATDEPPIRKRSAKRF